MISNYLGYLGYFWRVFLLVFFLFLFSWPAAYFYLDKYVTTGWRGIWDSDFFFLCTCSIRFSIFLLAYVEKFSVWFSFVALQYLIRFRFFFPCPSFSTYYWFRHFRLVFNPSLFSHFPISNINIKKHRNLGFQFLTQYVLKLDSVSCKTKNIF